MKRYHVRVAQEAIHDLDSIYCYIKDTLQNPPAAKRIYGKLVKGMASLEIMPERVRVMESEHERALGLRKLIVGHYFIIFNIKDDVVNINILYCQSDISSRLK